MNYKLPLALGLMCLAISADLVFGYGELALACWSGCAWQSYWSDRTALSANEGRS